MKMTVITTIAKQAETGFDVFRYYDDGSSKQIARIRLVSTGWKLTPYLTSPRPSHKTYASPQAAAKAYKLAVNFWE